MKNVALLSKNLRQRKRQWVSRMIRESAMKLFAENGFDETTTDQIAEAAGVSRRSFFRYFASKDDLFGNEIVMYGEALSELIAASPAGYTQMQILEETAMHLGRLAESEPMTANVIAVLQSSLSARQAQSSRLPEAREKVAAAYAKRLGLGREDDMRAYLLSTLTFGIIEVATRSWHLGENSSLPKAVTQALHSMSMLTGRPQEIAEEHAEKRTSAKRARPTKKKS